VSLCDFQPFVDSLILSFRVYRWLIELPSDGKALKETREKIFVVVPHSTKVDFIESVYEIAEIFQSICSKMNSYFGKKVKINLKIIGAYNGKAQIIVHTLLP
jgi:hypothetical protein